jgi:hypothetical protein
MPGRRESNVLLTISQARVTKKAFLKGLTEQQFDDIAKMEMVLDGNFDFIPAVHVEPKNYRSIHINFKTFLMVEITELSVARTIIHEASHKFCNTQDYAYAHPPEIYKVTPTHQKGMECR